MTHPTMTDDQFQSRALELLVEESGEPLAYWWLSFAGEEGFRGACIVQAHGILSATSNARLLDCNPGGEVMGLGPMPLDTPIPIEYIDRLLTKAECEKLDEIMCSFKPGDHHP